jgi:predicted ribosome quality control (RQC) complex YloA/Tae2 family protein
MAFDGVLLNGLLRELKRVLINGRIDRIHQPESDEIHIIIRNHGENHKLLLSASANYPRIHLTKTNKANPIAPPMFCMVLRKHLMGSRLMSINQPGFERILELTFETLSELGDLTEKKLVIEIMGRHSNIILTDNDGKILDSIKHVGSNISRVREVLPGKQYISPPSQGKSDPLIAEQDHIESLFTPSESNARPERILANSFTGISRTTAEEICRKALGEGKPNCHQVSIGKKIACAFLDFFSYVREGLFQPVILLDEQGKPKDILPFPYGLFPSKLLKHYQSFSLALDDFFEVRDRVERIHQRTSHLQKVIKNNLERASKKLTILHEEMEKAEKAEVYRLYGELITSNIYNIPSGADLVTLNNYYDPDNAAIEVPMDPTKSPAQNAQSYFKLYNKAKTTIEKHSKFIKETEDEIRYLDSLAEHLNMCTEEADIQEIREELAREGYIRRESRKGKPKQDLVSKPHRFVSSDGFEIFVGKNNTQNDYLTLKMAGSNDLWLHTKVIPGSHVIIKTKGQSVPESTLKEAANLAAFYSKGRASSNVPVDYCPKKNVRKPSGAKPGMVIYDQYKTLYITPSEEMVRAMKKL